ncbi:cyclodeaminase/cyclohydrolase family protein [Microbacterium sp. RD1]|uniref:cyclodeaminase/cyclohydrolase family protein n=1 Tax=Microbacterium sp. RD1 TaxID=3457313 RepID=UPI003FA5D43A
MQTDPDVPTSLGLDDWLARLAAPTGAPGGGSAAGVLMAIAAALLHMVCAYTPDEPRAAAAAERVGALRGESLSAARLDGVRSVALGTALREDTPDRDAAITAAASAAAASSAGLAEIGVALTAELRVIAEVGNRAYAADTAVAGESLRAGIGAALVNLRSNLKLAAAHADASHPAAEDSGSAAAVDRAEHARTAVDAVLAALAA